MQDIFQIHYVKLYDLTYDLHFVRIVKIQVQLT